MRPTCVWPLLERSDARCTAPSSRRRRVHADRSTTLGLARLHADAPRMRGARCRSSRTRPTGVAHVRDRRPRSPSTVRRIVPELPRQRDLWLVDLRSAWLRALAARAARDIPGLCPPHAERSTRWLSHRASAYHFRSRSPSHARLQKRRGARGARVESRARERSAASDSAVRARPRDLHRRDLRRGRARARPASTIWRTRRPLYLGYAYWCRLTAYTLVGLGPARTPPGRTTSSRRIVPPTPQLAAWTRGGRCIRPATPMRLSRLRLGSTSPAIYRPRQALASRNRTSKGDAQLLRTLEDA